MKKSKTSKALYTGVINFRLSIVFQKVINVRFNTGTCYYGFKPVLSRLDSARIL